MKLSSRVKRPFALAALVLTLVLSGAFPPSSIVASTTARYSESHQKISFHRQLVERVRALPGVEAASIGFSVPPENVDVVESFEL